MSRLLVKLQIPIRNTPFIFHRWLPIGPENGISYDRANYHLVLWFSLACINRTARITEIPYIRAHTIYANVIVDDLNDQFIHYMTVRDYTRMPTPEEEPLAQRYEEHGREVFSLIRDGLNYLLTYVRTEKGQYWLTPYAIDLDDMTSRAVEFRAQACIDNGPWFQWQPSQVSRLISIVLASDHDQRHLTQEDWPHAQEFLTQGRTPNRTRELLAGAEFLAHSGYSRAALTEAVSALEVALDRFSKSPKADTLFQNSLRARLGVEFLSNLVDRHLGLSGSVALLLPLLLPEEELPTDILKHCRDAIEQRNNCSAPLKVNTAYATWGT